MYKIFESYRKMLDEDVYSKELRNFIRFSEKTEKFDAEKRNVLLHQFLDAHNLKKLSQGSFREVYQSPEGEILKILRPDAWHYQKIPPLEQNKLEIKVFNRDKYGVFPKVMEFDTKDQLWYVVERVVPFDKDFESLGKVFPKLVSLIGEISEKNSYNLPPPATLEVVRYFLLFYKVKRTHPTSREEQGGHSRSSKMNNIVYNIIMRLSNKMDDWTSLEDPENQKLHKKYMDLIYTYLNNPDSNFVKIRNAYMEEQLDEEDFFPSNMGRDDEYNVKLIDIAYGDVG